ncbi:MAG: family 16 glycosylhydrolase [Trebonia sp.]|jgi:beta-glucanase (GH16 family)
MIILAAAIAVAGYSGAKASAGGDDAGTGGQAATGTIASTTAAAAAIKWGAPVFVDNFNGTTLGKSWSVYNSPTANPRRTPDSVRVRGGYLQLTGHYEKRYGYVGGGISDDTDRLYGRWEVRFRADAGVGYDPIVLLWPKGKWPDDGEIDLAEVPYPQRNEAGEYLHLGKENRFIGKLIPKPVNFTKWHTIAVDWLPDHITFWLDGKALWTVKRATGDANYVPSTPFHLALQNDEGCDGGCKPGKGTPAQVIMDVDWVKVYAVPHSAPAAVTATAYSPNGGYLATADGKGHVYVRSLPGFKLEKTLTDPGSKGVNGLAFTSQSHYVAAADGNGHVYIWTVATGKLNGTVTDPGSKGVRGVSYSPDGKSMSTADANGHIYIWSGPNYTLSATLTNPVPQ